MSPRTSGPIGAVVAVAIAITSTVIPPAAAAPIYGGNAPAVARAQPALAATPVSTRHYRSRNAAAALGVLLGIAGGIAALAAARHGRYGYDRYGYPYGYDAAPDRYDGPYGPYAPYGGRRW